MKGIMISALMLLAGSIVGAGLSCNRQMLQNYGFEGLSDPISYQSLKMSNNYCPDIKQSCCTENDFEVSNNLWSVRVVEIKKYLTKIFRIFQKIAMVQSSLIDLYNRVPEEQKTKPFCQDVDASFFNSPVSFDRIYFFLGNALDAFGFLQKGFYCTICDARNHQFLFRERSFSKKTVLVTKDFCSNLIFFFKEYIVYRKFFFEPLIKNMNNISRCINRQMEDFIPVRMGSRTNYHNVKACLLDNKKCDFICKEFRFGSSSELFVGDLKEYSRVLRNIELLLQTLGPQEEIFNEIQIDENDYESEFFKVSTYDQTPEASSLTASNISYLEVEVDEGQNGIDLFKISQFSDYYLTDQYSNSEIKQNYFSSQSGSDNNPLQHFNDSGSHKENNIVSQYSNTQPTVEENKEATVLVEAPSSDTLDNNSNSDPIKDVKTQLAEDQKKINTVFNDFNAENSATKLNVQTSVTKLNAQNSATKLNHEI